MHSEKQVQFMSNGSMHKQRGVAMNGPLWRVVGWGSPQVSVEVRPPAKATYTNRQAHC